MRRHTILLFLILFTGVTFIVPLSIFPHHALALLVEPQWTGDDDLRARFLIDDEDPSKAALYIRMQKGWHTYWVVPGDAGLPPRLTWTNQNNIKDIKTSHPAPKRFNEAGFTTFGHQDTLILPLRITRQNTGRQSSADLTLNIMICKDICIPKTLDMHFDTRNTVSLNNGDKQALAKAHENLTRLNTYGLTLQNVQISSEALTAEVTLPATTHRAAHQRDDIEHMDMFAVIYDTPEAAKNETENGIPLVGSVQKTINPKNGRVRFFIPRNSDIDDLNLYTRGKLIRVLVSYRDSGVQKDIRLPAPPKRRKQIRIDNTQH